MNECRLLSLSVGTISRACVCIFGSVTSLWDSVRTGHKMVCWRVARLFALWITLSTVGCLSLHESDNYHALQQKNKQILEFAYGNSKDVWSWGRTGLLGDNDESANDIELEPEEDKHLRLPLEVVPVHYSLQIFPIFEENSALGQQWTAPGTVRILVEAKKPEKIITLHSVRLNITNATMIHKESGKPVHIQSHSPSKKRYDQYILFLEEELAPGLSYEINLTFVAPISLRRPDGLYRSHYKDPQSKNISYLLSTQLEFFHARQVFPCFDEPGLKTTFDIAIGRSSKHHSLSNSNLVSSVPLEGTQNWFIDKFNTTVKMPTYLVAFVVSDFTFSQADLSFGNRPVRVYGPPYLIEEGAGDFGANVSANVLAFYEKYFEVDYPMPKMDSAAIPGFYYGAMENYGLNVYREVLLLDTPGSTTQHHRSRTSGVIAHETAHQFFGNLVTCKFWDNIWLNEGFATYYSYVGQNATNPEFEPMKQFLIEGPQYAFALDSRESSSHPILLEAKSQNQIADQAIGLPYYKGASLIRMMQGFLTPNTFHKGIKRYLKTWAHKAAEQDDLFQALTEQGHEDGTLSGNLTVKEIMDPWTKQKGYPLVRVISSDEDTLYILYERYKNPNVKEKASWPIPISYVTEDDPSFQDHAPKLWIPEGSVVRKIQHNNTKWIIVNHETTGFYRVVYDKKLTRLLHHQFQQNYSVISPFARSQLLDDYFALGFQKEVPIEMALEFTKHFGEETEDICWTVFLRYMRRLHHFYTEDETLIANKTENVPSQHFKGFKDYIVPKLESALSKLGFEQLPSDKGAVVMFRARLLNMACRMGSEKCLDYASRLFELWKSDANNTLVPVDLREFTYCYGVAAGGLRNWVALLEKSATETNARNALMLVKGLACIRDQGILKSMLESTLQGGNDTLSLDRSSADLIYDAVIHNPLGRKAMLDFVTLHMPDMKKEFNVTFDPVIYRIFLKLGSYLHTEEELIAMQTALEKHSKILGDMHHAVSSYLSDVEENIVWISKYYEPMQKWFELQLPRTIK